MHLLDSRPLAVLQTHRRGLRLRRFVVAQGIARLGDWVVRYMPILGLFQHLPFYFDVNPRQPILSALQIFKLTLQKKNKISSEVTGQGHTTKVMLTRKPVVRDGCRYGRRNESILLNQKTLGLYTSIFCEFML